VEDRPASMSSKRSLEKIVRWSGEPAPDGPILTGPPRGSSTAREGRISGVWYRVAGTAQWKADVFHGTRKNQRVAVDDYHPLVQFNLN